MVIDGHEQDEGDEQGQIHREHDPAFPRARQTPTPAVALRRKPGAGRVGSRRAIRNGGRVAWVTEPSTALFQMSGTITPESSADGSDIPKDKAKENWAQETSELEKKQKAVRD